MKKIIQWSMGIIAIVVVFYYGFIAPRLTKKEVLGEAFPSQGQTHIEIGATHPTYNSNPPSSGHHYAKPADWGVYQTELPDEQLVHNLEHGGIWISYKDIDAETKSKIEDFAKQHPNKMIVTPRAKNDKKIALASWTRLLTLDAFDEATASAFVSANKNQAPEPYAP